jgi:hypothetical protein
MTIVTATAVSIPLIVAGTVCLIARADGSPVPSRALVRLVLATVAALVVVGLVLAPGLAMANAAALFVLFVTPVTRALERSCGAEKRASVRTADLVPRTAVA